jgi:hypothetical protein
MIIKKSVEDIKRRAIEMEEVRKSPQRYKNVKSKVSRCIKVQTRVAKSKTATRNRNMMQTYTQQYQEDDLSRANQSIASFQNGRDSALNECISLNKDGKTEVFESEHIVQKIRIDRKKNEDMLAEVDDLT